MHELSIAMSILDMVEEEMERHPGAQVEAVHLRIGPLSGVVKEALTSAYELARAETPFPNSRLVFEDVPLVVYCRRCEAERAAESIQQLCCTECGEPAGEIRRGRELEIAALELEEELE